jgi:ferredoxin
MMVEKKQVEVDNADVVIKFEPEGREGLVAEGTYLSEAANRFGIFFAPGCDRNIGGEEKREHCCAVVILQGAELLSVPTQEEIDNLSEEARVKGERLACQTRIERSGELVVEIMEKEEVKDEKVLQDEKFQDFRKDFSELPLDKKMGELMQLEAIALGETFSFVMNLPFTIGDQIMGVMAGFGKKMDEADREAKHPKEHTEQAAATEENIGQNPAENPAENQEENWAEGEG